MGARIYLLKKFNGLASFLLVPHKMKVEFQIYSSTLWQPKARSATKNKDEIKISFELLRV